MLTKLFPRNEGALDRGARVAVGLGLLSLVVLVPTWWGLVGLVPLLTGVLGSCPLYTVFGFSSCPIEPKRT